MQDETLAVLITLVFLISLAYIFLIALLSPFWIVRFHTNQSIFNFKKRIKLRQLYARRPLEEQKKLRVRNRVLQISNILMILLIAGHFYFSNFGYTLISAVIMCVFCFISWQGTKLHVVRRIYWKKVRYTEFRLVSDKRFKFSQFCYKSLLVAYIVMSMSFLVNAICFGANG